VPDTTAFDVRGRSVLDTDGEKIGKADELYFDDEGGQPEWALVNTGLFGTKKTFVPLAGARMAGDDVRVRVSKQQVKDAPRIEADEEISEAEERQLFEHYGVPYTTEGSTTARSNPASPGRGRAGGSDHATTHPAEEVRVGKRSREAGRVRLRKYVVTERVTKTGPVQREEARVEREPIEREPIEREVSEQVRREQIEPDDDRDD